MRLRVMKVRSARYMRPLLLPDIQAITPSGHQPRRDRAPDSLAMGTSKLLREDLVALLGAAQVLTRPIDLVRFATDASPYRVFRPGIGTPPLHREMELAVPAHHLRHHLCAGAEVGIATLELRPPHPRKPHGHTADGRSHQGDRDPDVRAMTDRLAAANRSGRR
jgi:hypothetical protein